MKLIRRRTCCSGIKNFTTVIEVILIASVFNVSESGDPPMVAAFSFPAALKEGERGSAACTIRSGDTPLEFKWLKDGQDAEEFPNLKIQSLMDSSLLVIPSVTPKSSGNYTCIVKNAFGSDRYTAAVAVTSPPVWKKEPYDLSTMQGESEIIHCEATGVPTPSMKWMKGEKGMEEILSDDISSNIKSLLNGTLLLSKVEASMEGSYTCTADNDFGAPLSKTVYITVRKSPVVSPFILPDALREGERASTICTIRSGDRPLEFEWKKDGEKISESSYLKIQSVPDSSILVIESVTAQSSGNYTCIVKNAYGSDRFTAVLTVTVPPVWLEEPQSVLTQEGETVSIPCAATGVPAPKIKWTSVKEGERGSATCTIKSGDSPFQFEWLKDGKEVKEAAHIKIQSVLDSSFLVIQSVTSESSGNYTCIVKNSYGSDRFTSSLTVTAPPVWLKEPADVIVQEGERLSIECMASGVPVPAVKWISENGRNEIFTSSSDISSRIAVSQSGALEISKVEANMKGLYTCEADNGFGKPLSKTISISVRGT
ncbi:Down syndrome cell adhesion molecule-like protein Dscam2 [Stegodyphus dumicola]|uniref:Down syndrome cell adhesion molecule-like protein Dscam2 n=1 Tax=Stegodyphus dumicola TaxID=202533 RepID=UPI0015ADE786|nr:Down syndrome cell adhesion molecule-like protein Dscam2 [Stegodyphus dumicola]